MPSILSPHLQNRSSYTFQNIGGSTRLLQIYNNSKIKERERERKIYYVILKKKISRHNFFLTRKFLANHARWTIELYQRRTRARVPRYPLSLSPLSLSACEFFGPERVHTRHVQDKRHASKKCNLLHSNGSPRMGDERMGSPVLNRIPLPFSFLLSSPFPVRLSSQAAVSLFPDVNGIG